MTTKLNDLNRDTERGRPWHPALSQPALRPASTRPRTGVNPEPVERRGNPYLDDVSLARSCAEHLARHRGSIVAVLTRFESHETATAEIESSIDALENLHRELMNFRRGSLPSVAVFLPINLPLYSLVLFAAIPSLMADHVEVRMPAATPEWVRDVAEVAQLGRFFPRLHLRQQTRRQFIERCASLAAAVIFTGRHEAAEDVRAQCPESLFIFQGSGINPIVIGADAELTADVVDRMITARIFNGGQDCAAPDAFLVHRSKAQGFVRALVAQASTWTTGTYDDHTVRIGPIMNIAPFEALETRLDALREDIVIGGRVHRELAFVEPTVVVRPLSDHDELTEFFAPVFYVLVYDNDHDLSAFFDSPEYVENAMYVSLFGQDPVPGLFASSTVLFNQTVLDVEQGNAAFGGGGSKSNYVVQGGETTVGPALISEALSRSRMLS